MIRMYSRGILIGHRSRDLLYSLAPRIQTVYIILLFTGLSYAHQDIPIWSKPGLIGIPSPVKATKPLRGVEMVLLITGFMETELVKVSWILCEYGLPDAQEAYK